MTLDGGVVNGETRLVEHGRPAQQGAIEFGVQLPAGCNLIKQLQGSGLNPRGLLLVDMVEIGNTKRRARANILMLLPLFEFIQQTFA
jgi:hypothetical protein